MWLFKKILNVWAISSKSIFNVLLVICLIRNVENHKENCYLLVFLILLHKYLICYFLTMIKYWLQITNILNYNFPNHFNATMLKATMIFENPQVRIMDLPTISENNLITKSKNKLIILLETLEQHPYGCLALWMANLDHYLPNSR